MTIRNVTVMTEPSRADGWSRIHERFRVADETRMEWLNRKIANGPESRDKQILKHQRVCAECGKSFWSSHRDTKICSTRCRSTAGYRLRLERRRKQQTDPA